MWGILFAGTGLALQDKETWALDEESEANELAERTLNWFRGIDKKRSAVWEKRLATWQPLISLLIMLVTITGPRLAATRAKRRVHIPQKTNHGSNAAQPAASSSPAATSSNGVHTPGGPVARQFGTTRGYERPLRSQDIDELFGEGEPG